MTAEKIYNTAFDVAGRFKGLKGKVRAQLRGSAQGSKVSSTATSKEPPGSTSPSAPLKKTAPNSLDEATRASEPSYLGADGFFFIEHGEDAGGKIPTPIEDISSDDEVASTHFSFDELRECYPNVGPSAPFMTREEPKETTEAITESSGATKETGKVITTPTKATKRADIHAPPARASAPFNTIPDCFFITSAHSSFGEVRDCYSIAGSSAPLRTHKPVKELKEKTEIIEAPSGATVPPTDTYLLDLQKATELQRIEQAELLQEAREEVRKIEKEYCEMQRQLKVDKAMREIWSRVGRGHEEARE